MWYNLRSLTPLGNVFPVLVFRYFLFTNFFSLLPFFFYFLRWLVRIFQRVKASSFHTFWLSDFLAIWSLNLSGWCVQFDQTDDSPSFFFFLFANNKLRRNKKVKNSELMLNLVFSQRYERQRNHLFLDALKNRLNGIYWYAVQCRWTLCLVFMKGVANGRNM